MLGFECKHRRRRTVNLLHDSFSVHLRDLRLIELHDLVDSVSVGLVVVGDQLAAVLAPGFKVVVGRKVDDLKGISHHNFLCVFLKKCSYLQS